MATPSAGNERDGWTDLRRQLRDQPAVSRARLAALVQEHVGVGVDYAARRLRREGVIAPVTSTTRGLYLVTTGEGDGSFLTDPIAAIVAHVGEATCFCYGSALQLHGLSRYVRLNEYFVATDKPRNTRRVGQVRLRFVKTPVGEELGVTSMAVDELAIRVTDVERTIIDCIHRPKYAQGWENVMHALQRVEQLDGERACDYLKHYRLPSLVAKAGLVLNHFAKKWNVSDDELARLRAYLPPNPVSFFRDEPGRLDKKWRVYVPEGVLA